MPSLRRIEKVSMLMREEIARTIEREVEFGEGVMVTITHVVISPDGFYATAYFSVLGGHAGAAFAILQKNVYDIQQAINRVLRMRPVPKIRFAVDEEEERRERVEESLARLKKNHEL